MARETRKLLQLVQALLDDNRSDACLNVETREKPRGFVQVLLHIEHPEVYCPNCNTRQYHDAVFCHRCGTPLPQQDHRTRPTSLLFNFGYPHTEEPLQLLRTKGIDLPLGSEIATWEKSTSATLIVPLLNAHQIEGLIHRILGDVQGVKLDAAISASLDFGY
jgi:hypothetical protein